MEKNNELLNFEITIEAIQNLSENDAKSLLKIIYGYVNTAITGNGGDSFKLEVIDKLAEIYHNIPEINDIMDHSN